jgi:hypothetical protein
MIIDTYIHDGSTNLVPLQYVPTQTTGITDWYRDTIPTQYGQSDEIEVFVGGYKIKGMWEAESDYSANEIVVYGSYMFRCVESHRSSESFNDDKAKWQYFVGTQRLKKVPYFVYNNDIHPESDDGDQEFEADFSVDGSTAAVRLTTDLTPGTKVVVIKKVGRIWNDPNKSLAESDNKIANFLKNSSTLFPR